MKLIKSSVTNITPYKFFEEDILKHIELCGRTCYKSEDKITDTSAEKFVNMLKKNKHRSVLEHGTVYLWTRETSYNFMNVWKSDLFDKYDKNPYSIAYMDGPDVYITTNYRVIIENGWEDDLDFIVAEPIIEFHESRYTFRIICSRAIANEIVRHRQMSFSQESTRYCDYSNEKFNKSLIYIIPYKFQNDIRVGDASNFHNNECYNIKGETCEIYNENVKGLSRYLISLYEAEQNYFALRKEGWKPEEARGVLPLDLKTDLVVTGTKNQWDAFFKLRCGKSAHPDIQVIANKIKKYIYE